MILEETIKKLHDLKLRVMADAVRELVNKPPGHQLSFEEQLGVVVEQEWTERQNTALARRLKLAKLGQSACLEDVWCEPERGIDKAVVRGFATCQWVRSKQTSSSSDRPAWARATSARRSRRLHAATAFARSVRVYPDCFTSWGSREPTAAT
jgi:hypothetical protein